MAVQIRFDANHNVRPLTLVLSNRNGNRINTLPAYDTKLRGAFNDYSSIEFKVNKHDCELKGSYFWDQIVDFKLIYCRESNRWYEISVNVDESNYLEKSIIAKSLGEAELSQINLYGIEINTESDISRDNYKPSILYNEDDPSCSILHRITEKVPNYKITHVDVTIAKIQRTFSFDKKTVYDALQEIGKEINCIFILDVVCDSDGAISREIKAYDLESYCVDCGKRGEYDRVCTNCGSSSIIPGYGKDTSVSISTNNLADSIKYSTNVEAVKNCFKLVAGDDLMTATVASCNPNGSPYIWLITDKQKADMSPSLVERIDGYDEIYAYYQDKHEIRIAGELQEKYNGIVQKYSQYADDLKPISSKVVGYPALMNAYYDTIDLYLLLNHSLAPKTEKTETDAITEVSKLTTPYLSPVSVQDFSKVSLSTASNAVLSMAKILIDSTRYQVKTKDEHLDGNVWTGVFMVKSYSNEEDFAESDVISVIINDDYSTFVEQKLNKALSTTSDNVTDVVLLFSMSDEAFKNEIGKYSLSRLMSFRNACQTGLDVLVEQGVANKDSLNANLYDEMYKPMYDKLLCIDDEIDLRESEITIVTGKMDSDGEIIENGVQTILTQEKNRIQSALDMRSYLGEELWMEFIAYRREDVYQNDNYISDGLNNAELFERALEFIECAKKEIYKSATLQHTITASMKNLLVMKEFAPIIENFEVGNWIRVKVDDVVYKLRLIEYQIDYNDLAKLSVVFSDVKAIKDGISDIESIISQAASMASSYGSVARQASQGKKSNSKLEDWVTKGLALTKMKIVDNADSQNLVIDSHGLLCKEYLPMLSRYDAKQLKIINRGLYLTDDNWVTARAGIGDFTFYNPMTEKVESSYGVIADTLVGNLILSEKVGIYNTKNSITLDENGLVVTALATEEDQKTMFKVRKKTVDDEGNVSYTDHLFLDDDGNLVINGTIRIQSSLQNASGMTTLDELKDRVEIETEILKNAIDVKIENIYDSIDRNYASVMQSMESQMTSYKAELGQYLYYDENGLTLGATTSQFKTVIDNTGLYFKQGNSIVSYVSNNYLHIPNAIIENTMILGRFFFSPHEDGSVSLTWQ